MAKQLERFQAYLQVINQPLKVQSLGRGLVIPVLLLLHSSILEDVVVVGPGRLCNVHLQIIQPTSWTATTPQTVKANVTEQATLPTQLRYTWFHPGLQDTTAGQMSSGHGAKSMSATGSTGKFADRHRLRRIQGKDGLTLAGASRAMHESGS